ncbi:S49 family peptidase [Pseudoduganella namucuonensis]|nr:S49 family peptidase [Pseudoduganella namucuonensis]
MATEADISTQDISQESLAQLVADLHAQQVAIREEQRLAAKERRAERRWNFGFRAVLVIAPIGAGALFLAGSTGFALGPLRDVVGVVHIKGEIAQGMLASADKVVPALEDAFSDGHVKHVVLAIDSPGGAPAEAERIAQAITILKKRHPKPVTAIIGNMGASAAYMAAMHADRIVAGKYSLVGSIGAIIAPWRLDQAIAQFHVSQRVYASGKLKAFLNPFTPVSEESNAKAQQLVSHVGAMFVQELVAQRGPRLKQHVDYGTGEIWSGEEAKALGLVDEIGSLESLVRNTPSVETFNFGPRESSLARFASSMGRAAADTIVGMSSWRWGTGLR